MIKLENISKSYHSNSELEVLKDINLECDNSTIVTIYGNSGTGKTTLLNILGLIDNPTNGYVYIDDKKITNYNKIDSLRIKTFGYIFQDHYLFPEFTVIENLMLPLIISSNKKNDLALNLLDRFDLLYLKDKYPSSISFGEAQRIAVLRSIINKPRFIIADEPTSSLDDENASYIVDLFEDLKNQGYSILIATHDKRFIEKSDNSFKLYNKNLMEIKYERKLH